MNVSEWLKAKHGPLPGWAYAGLGGIALIYLFMRKRASSTATTGATNTNPLTYNPADFGYIPGGNGGGGNGGGNGGGGGGGGGSGFPAIAPLSSLMTAFSTSPPVNYRNGQPIGPATPPVPGMTWNGLGWSWPNVPNYVDVTSFANDNGGRLPSGFLPLPAGGVGGSAGPGPITTPSNVPVPA